MKPTTQEAGPQLPLPAKTAIDPTSTPELPPRARLRLLLGMRLLDRLEAGRPVAGTRLPSIRAVARAARVHRNTVALVYRDLAVLGLMRCGVGSGSYASQPPTPDPFRRMPLICADESLARWWRCATDLPCEWNAAPGSSCASGSVLLHPLHSAPGAARPAYPLAPVRHTRARVLGLPRHGRALIESQCVAIQRLMYDAIRAVHGASVGILLLDGDADRTLSSAPPSRRDILFHDPWEDSDEPIGTRCPIQVAVCHEWLRSGTEPGTIPARSG